MKSILVMAVVVGMSFTVSASAGDLTKDAAVGGGVGGALGGAVGAELGGREGAIIGAGIGAATGAAVATKDHQTESKPKEGAVVVVPANPPGKFCPPGQAKKGRC